MPAALKVCKGSLVLSLVMVTLDSALLFHFRDFIVRRCARLFPAKSFVVCTPLTACPNTLSLRSQVSLYTVEPSVQAKLHEIFPYLCMFLVVDGFMGTQMGVMRAMGKQVTEYSSAEEPCVSHVTISPAMLRSSNDGVMRAMGKQMTMSWAIFGALWCSTLPTMQVRMIPLMLLLMLLLMPLLMLLLVLRLLVLTSLLQYFAFIQGGGLISLWQLMPLGYVLLDGCLLCVVFKSNWQAIADSVIERKRQIDAATRTAAATAADGAVDRGGGGGGGGGGDQELRPLDAARPTMQYTGSTSPGGSFLDLDQEQREQEQRQEEQRSRGRGKVYKDPSC